MKTQLQLKLILLFCFLTSIGSAQFVEYSRDSKWNIGINAGGVWQDADINLNYPGFGYGFTFGRALYERPGSFFALDLRFRYLRGKSYGLDGEKFMLDSTYSNDFGKYADSVGYTYLNNKTDLHDYSLEAVLSFNRLREQTGILFHVFGGIGLTDYQTKMNLFGADSAIYDYSTISSDPNTAESELSSILDDTYESNAPTHSDRNKKIMPSLGIGLGYQITPVISIGVEHRATFTLNDVFDGVEGPGSEWLNLKNSNMDIYHYTSLFFRWNIMKGKSTEDESYTDPYNPCDKPFVGFSSPNQGEKFLNPYVAISAQVSRINGNNDIVIKVNGKAIPTQYSQSTELVTAESSLVKGNNTIQIIASNSCGQITETRTVVFEPKECPVPVVAISAPFSGTVNSPSQILQASAVNVGDGNITVTINGKNITPAYNASNGSLTANLVLTEGSNTIRVQANNSCGQDSQTVTVFYSTTPCLAPVVSIFSPLNGQTANQQTANVSASIQNITNVTQVVCKLNGAVVNGSYSLSSKSFNTTVNLVNGSNTIEIIATNECGSITKTVTANYVCNPPVVSILSPANGFVVEQAYTQLSAVVSQVTAKNEIQVYTNGINQPFTFNTVNGALNGVITLKEGANVVEVVANTACGADKQTLTIIYKLPCEVPVVTVTSPIDNQNFSVASTNVTAQVNNVTNKSAVSVAVNGVNTAFTFNGNSINALANLTKGNNTIRIQANNSCGQDDKVVLVTYDAPCPLPSVSFISPSNGKQFKDKKVSILAQTNNITSQNQAIVTLNGQVVAFTYNSSDKRITSTLDLIEGNNTIAIKVQNECGIDEKLINVNYTCDKPVINMRGPANGTVVTSEVLNINGTVTNLTSANQLSIKLNGVNQMVNYTNGVFSASTKLKAGNNVFTITAANTCGSEVKTINVTYNAPCDAPTVSINSPNNAATVNQETVAFNAITSNVTSLGELNITLNGVKQVVSFSGSSVSGTFKLKAGLNTIVVTAQTACGTDTKQVQVTYTCDKPVINMRGPANGTVVTSEVLNINGTVTNLTSANQLSIKLNGINQMVNYTNGSFSASTKLKAGNNVFTITAANTCGSEVKTINVTYNAPCDAPTVSINSPNNAATVNQETVKFNAVTSNVTSLGELNITLNGVKQVVSFSGSSVSGTFKLKAGLNTIVVTAQTACGTDSKQVQVTYTCDKPVINMRGPANGTVVTSEVLNINGTVTNLTSASQLSIKLNGVNQTVNYTNGLFSASTKLKAGNNVFTITAANICGSEVKTINVTYNAPCEKPSITVISPATSKKQFNASTSFSITVKNVSSASDISLKLNGKELSFKLVGETAQGVITDAVNGRNTIQIEANNRCGKQTLTHAFVQEIKEPTIKITSPANGFETADTEIEIKGATDSPNTSFTWNGKGIAKPALVKNKDGLFYFTVTVPVTKGENKLVAIATNGYGYSKEASVSVVGIDKAEEIKKTPIRRANTGGIAQPKVQD